MCVGRRSGVGWGGRPGGEAMEGGLHARRRPLHSHHPALLFRSRHQTKPPNAAHKRPCILGVLEDAVKVRGLWVRSKPRCTASCAYEELHARKRGSLEIYHEQDAFFLNNATRSLWAEAQRGAARVTGRQGAPSDHRDGRLSHHGPWQAPAGFFHVLGCVWDFERRG